MKGKPISTERSAYLCSIGMRSICMNTIVGRVDVRISGSLDFRQIALLRAEIDTFELGKDFIVEFRQLTNEEMQSILKRLSADSSLTSKVISITYSSED